MSRTGFAIAVTLLFTSLGSPLCALEPYQRAQKTSPTRTTSEAPLANADVVRLSNLGLGEEVVIAKINQAKAVDFKLGTDDLAKLMKQGVSKGIITAMLKRATPQMPPPPQTAPPPQAAATQQREPIAGTGPSTTNPQPWQKASPIRIQTKAGETPLSADLARFRIENPGSIFRRHLIYELPGMQSRSRTTDKGVRFLVTSKFPPQGYFFLARLVVSSKDNSRTLHMAKRTPGPDEDYLIEFSIETISDLEWRLIPKAPLNPGEYCVWAREGAQGGVYDFGVDP